MMFWENVKTVIKERNTTQEAIANECNISFATFRGWVSKGILPKVDNGVSIAKALGVTSEFLVTGVEPGQENFSDIHKRFYKWIDSMSDEEMETIENLFEVLGTVGEGLKE